MCHVLLRAGLLPAIFSVVLAIFALNPDSAQARTSTRGGAPISATAVSKHFVEVRFSDKARPEWANAAAYRIAAPDGTTLPVEAVDMNPEGDAAILTTGSQQAVPYQFAVTDGLKAARASRQCQARQLDAAGALCRAELECWSQSVAHPDASANTARRVQCLAAVRKRFARAQARAVAQARREGGGCEVDGKASEFVDTLLLEPMARLRGELLLADWNASAAARPDSAFRAGMLRASGRFCAALFDIESKQAERSPNGARLSARRAAARGRFDALATQAANRAAREGLAPLPFEGARAADWVEALVGGTVADTTPRLRVSTARAAAPAKLAQTGSSMAGSAERVAAAATPIAPTAFIVFQGSDTQEPFLHSAVALDSTHVLVTFSAAMDPTTAEARELYRIVLPELAVLSATLLSGGQQVQLVTASQDAVEYTLEVGGLVGTPVAFPNPNKPVRFIIDPNRRITTFYGILPNDTEAPRLLGAQSTGATEVLLSFSEPLAEGAANASLYRIVAPDGKVLPVAAAVLTARNTQVRLTTVEQMPFVPYVLTVLTTNDLAGTQLKPVADRSGNPIASAAASATFRYLPLGAVPPTLVSAVSLGPDRVLLTFSEPLGSGADNPLFYRIASPELGITAATPSADGTNVTLTTTPQANVAYTVSATNLRSAAGGILLDPERDTATFHGRAALDDQRPSLRQAVATDSQTVRLSFSEPLADAAADPSHFTLNPVRTVLAAELSPQKTQIVLTTQPLAVGTTYTVTAANVFDRATPVPNGIDPNADTASFTYDGAGTGTSPGGAEPRVLGAASLDNTHVMVSFDRAMGNSALDPSAYFITQEVVNPEVGTLVISGNPIFRESASGTADPTTVVLTTLPQNEVTYRVTVVGVRDQSGTPLPPKRVEQGVLVDLSTATFPGTPPGSAPGQTDSDDDGLADFDEQRGWVVTIKLADGSTVARQVTSNPNNPDSDGDGLTDAQERSYLSDPRDLDTDDDLLTDYRELNEIYSDPFRQDTDGDGFNDGLEYDFFRTSPLLGDTDGDQIGDGVELLASANRNARVADLPAPTIEVGAVNLGLDVRFTETISNETRQLQAKSVNSTLQQTNATETSNSSSNTQEAMAKVAVGLQYEVEANFPKGAGTKVTSSFKAETAWTGSWTHSSEETSSRETQRAYESSLNTEAEVTQGATVTREVVGARMQATILLKNAGNLAFSIRNLQVTVFIQDPRNAARLIPVATLLPDLEPETGFALGPLQRERGPVIFSNDTIFPSLVEDLMKNPRGLVFRISNFDITDESGRNFVFTSQEIIDRTASLMIDSGSFDGDGDGVGDLTEYNRVATSAGRVIDTNGDGAIDGNDRRVTFDTNGKPVGITLREALAAIGLTAYEELTTPSATLTEDEQQRSYSTILDPAGIQRIFRLRKAAAQDGVPRHWEVLTPTGIDQTVGLDSVILRPEQDATLAFVQDLDQDRLESRLEYFNHCSDRMVDSDGDVLDDRFETLIGWTVDLAVQGARTVYSSCSRADTDGDGLTDAEEAPDLLTKVDTSGDGVPDIITRAANSAGHHATDPTSKDTDSDGVSDFDEVRGYGVQVRGDCNSPQAGQTITVHTDPTNADTDGDGASDGIERQLGGNPTDGGDSDCFGDFDGDGLVNLQETLGWDVVVRSTSSSPAVCTTVCNPGGAATIHVTSDENLEDTDVDGLSDSEEFALRTNPRSEDTDGDGILDFDEVRGFILRDQGIITTNPADADTDDDKLSDGVEAGMPPPTELQRWIVRPIGGSPYQVFSNPLQADADFDRLADGDERAAGTDPGKGNTDDDARDDYAEVSQGTNPLVEDFRVTVGFGGVKVIDDCDSPDTQSGDFLFNLGAIRPDGSFALAVTSSPFSTTPSAVLSLGNCESINGGNVLDDNLCRRTDSTALIQVQSGSTLPLGNRTVTFGVTVHDLFLISGSISEIDAGADTAGGFPFILDDPFPNLEVNGELRSSTFAGAELSNGTITGTFKKSTGCRLEIPVFMTVSGKL